MRKILIFKKYIISKILILFSVIINISFSINIDSNIIQNETTNVYNHKSTDNLFFVFQQSLHGARATVDGSIFNNTDILGGKWQKSAELTKVGKKQHYSIGKKNKLRYSKFLNGKYNPKEIQIYSTNYNSTIVSAQMQLLGLYDNISYSKYKNRDIRGDRKLKIKLNKIIPPVNLYEYNDNKIKSKYEVIYHDKFKCPLIKENIEKNKIEINNFESMNRILNHFNNKYYNIILNEFKLNITKTHEGFYNFCDAFISNYYDEDNNKLKLIELEKNNKNFNLTDILNICYEYNNNYYFVIGGEKHAKLNGIISMSKIMQKITNIMKDKINNDIQKYKNNQSPKFLLYSICVDTLTHMQMILKDTFNIEYEYMPYGSTQLFELRKYGDVFYVEIYYNDILKLNISFNEFNNEIQNKIMTEEEIIQKCYIKNKNIYSPYFFKIILLLVIFLLLLFILIFLLIYLNNIEIQSKKKNI